MKIKHFAFFAALIIITLSYPVLSFAAQQYTPVQDTEQMQPASIQPQNPVGITSSSALITTLSESLTNEQDFQFNAQTQTITKYVGSGGYVSIPDTINGVAVEGIGDNAFLNAFITGIIIPESVTAIGYHAFANCASLTDITIPKSVTSSSAGSSLVGGWFYGCTSLISVIIENGTTVILNQALNNIPTSVNVSIPNSVTTIEPYAFSSSKITGITIPESVTAIGYHAFDSCVSLTEITIPKSVTSSSVGSSLAGGWFNGCTSLVSVIIENGTSAILTQALSYIPVSANIVIPNSVTSIGAYAFSNSKITSINIPGSVTSIGDGAFDGCSMLTAISIPESVTALGYHAFSNCVSLTGVTIPKSVTSSSASSSLVGGWFYGCTSLVSVIIENGTTVILNQALNNIPASVNITIPNSVTTIEPYAFSSSKITSITIPESVTAIGYHAFDSCVSLTEITIPKSVTSSSVGSSLAGGWFNGCTSLVSVTIENGTSAILTQALSYISVSANIVIPNSVTSIGAYAFSNSKITSINIPGSVTLIGDGAFDGCSMLTGISLPESVTAIGYHAFSNCVSLTEITIPKNVTSSSAGSSLVGGWFYGCTSLVSITIENGTTVIPTQAFMYTPAIKIFIIPSTVINIGNYAFADCPNLSSAVFKGNAPSSFGTSVFNNDAADFVIVCDPNLSGWTSPTWKGYPTSTNTAYNNITYDLSYNSNGGEGTPPATITWHNGDAVIIADRGNLSRTGFLFDRWNTKADGTGVSYLPGESVQFTDGNVTLYVIWDTNDSIYVLTYNSNGGIGTMPTVIWHSGNAVTIADGGNLSKGGFLFNHWNSKADGAGINYFPGQSAQFTDNDLTLYAFWVTYDINLDNQEITGQSLYNASSQMGTKLYANDLKFIIDLRTILDPEITLTAKEALQILNLESTDPVSLSNITLGNILGIEIDKNNVLPETIGASYTASRIGMTLGDLEAAYSETQAQQWEMALQFIAISVAFDGVSEDSFNTPGYEPPGGGGGELTFSVPDDPMRDVTGPAWQSNPIEYNQILNELEDMGVTVNISEGSTMAYGPSTMGEPGTITMDPDASLSAWKHELQHAIDDMNSGWMGRQIKFTDPEQSIQWERNAYNVEIEEANAAGRPDVADYLETLFQNEVKRITDFFNPDIDGN